MKNIYVETVNSLRYYRNGVEVLNTEDPWKQNGDDIYFDGGNMAIGKTDAQTKLDVNGEIFAEGSLRSQYLSSLYSLKLSERTYANHNKIIAAGGGSSAMLLNTGKVLSFGNNGFGELGIGEAVNLREFPTSVETGDYYDGTNAVSIETNRFNMCILLETGRVLTVGYNEFGQLGNGTIVDSNIPVAVSDGAGYNGTNASMVSCGGDHSAILLNTGKIVTFGKNIDGQLGNGLSGGANNSSIPVEVVDPSGIYDGSNAVMVACGGTHTLILLNNGKVMGFGSNEGSRLGLGGTASAGPYTTPIEIAIGGGYNGNNAVMIATSYDHCAILLDTGAVLCFGSNNFGQTGVGTSGIQPILTPTPVTNGGGYDGTNAIMVNCGEGHTAILLNTGKVVTFGRNESGELGIGNTDSPKTTPIETIVGGGYNKENALAIVCGFNYTIVLLNDGKVIGFGGNNIGQLGIGNLNTPQLFAVDVSGVNGYDKTNAFYKTLDMAVGDLKTGFSNDRVNGLSIYSNRTDIEHYDFYHLKEHGPVNIYGQLNTDNDHLRKHYLDSLHSMKLDERSLANHTSLISGGAGHSGIILNNGKVLTFGDNNEGQLGIGSTISRSTLPVELDISGISYNAKMINCGDNHTAILLNTGKVVAFGRNGIGQLGIGNTITPQRSPVDVSGVNGYDKTNCVMVSCGALHTIILLNTGKVMTFGSNLDGQLGIGTSDASSNIPVDVSGANGYDKTNCVMICCGGVHTAILLNTGKILTFGKNDNGQLGNGVSGGNENAPVDVSGVSGYDGSNCVMVSCGSSHTAILLNTGKVLTFGNNSDGQLGNGVSGGNENAPVEVTDPSGIYDGTNAVMICCGGVHTAILLNTGKVLIFGRNDNGQLGIGNTDTPQTLPVEVSTTGNDYDGTNAVSISCGFEHTMILLNTGKVLTFGRNQFGQLGIGNIISPQSSPVDVADPSNNYNGENAFYENLMDLTFDDKKVGITNERENELSVYADKLHVPGSLIVNGVDLIAKLQELENRVTTLEP